MEIPHLPNKGKTYQLFDKDRPNGKDKYFVRVIGENIKCTCPGFWVSKGNCKHVKEIKSNKF